MGIINVICDGDYQKRDQVRSNFTIKQLQDLHDNPITINVDGPDLMPVGAPAAASMAAPMLQPEKETVTINMGDGNKISMNMDDIRKKIERDLFASTMIPGYMMRGR